MPCNDDQIRFFLCFWEKMKKKHIARFREYDGCDKRQPSITSKKIQQAQILEVTYSHKCMNMP